MGNVLTSNEVSRMVQILSQYTQYGWTALKTTLVTDEVHTEMTTWAVTETNPKHWFHLDDDDRAVLDELIDCAWERSGRTWNQIEFSVTSGGVFGSESKVAFDKNAVIRPMSENCGSLGFLSYEFE